MRRVICGACTMSVRCLYDVCTVSALCLYSACSGPARCLCGSCAVRWLAGAGHFRGSDEHPGSLVIALTELAGGTPLLAPEDPVEIGYVVEPARVSYLSYCLC